MNAAAIVVGIDAYPHLPELNGSVQDALDVVDWLLEIGVAPDRIRLHVAARGKPSLPAGVVALPATRDAIWSSMRGLQQDAGGDTLYVFLSGHGYYLARSGPIFLTADWSTDMSAKNLDVFRYADFLQGLKFKNVLLILDACQNLDVDSLYASPIRPNPPDDQSVDPDPKNGLLLCCATEQEQYAPIVGGRGLLTSTLLAALRQAPVRIPEAAGDAFAFDWLTGGAKIDLYPLFKWAVAPDVTRAAQANGHVQRPTMTPRGRLATEWRFMACDVPVETVPLKVSAGPLAGLNTIKISLTPPANTLELPLTTTPPMPFEGFVPKNRRLVAVCTPNENWEAEPPYLQVAKTNAEVGLHFSLKRLSPDPVRDGFNIKLIAPDGRLSSAIKPEDYDAADVADFIDAEEGSPKVVRRTTGFDVLLNGASRKSAGRLAEYLGAVLKDRVNHRLPGTEIVTAPPGRSWAAIRPNVRFIFPQGGSSEVVGLLEEDPLIHVGRIGGTQGSETSPLIVSARSLRKRPWRRLNPGAYRLVTDTPWGTGAATFEVLGDAPQTIEIPSPIGQPPLRNRPLGTDISTIDPPLDATGVARIDQSLTFVPPGLPLLVSRDQDTVRVEPFSSLPWAEWDMLIGAGRLQAVDVAKALERLDQALEDDATALLRLALAYAAWAQDDRIRLKWLIDTLSGVYAASMDAQLLTLALTADPGASPLAGRPYFRWAYRLAQLHAPASWPLAPPSPHSIWAVYALKPPPYLFDIGQAGTVASLFENWDGLQSSHPKSFA